MATPSYDVNYEDERFTQVESDKQEAMTDLEQTYGGMISDADKYYQAQIDASKEWADKQSQLQQEQTDFAIEQIEQQKDQAHKDYVKEQSGAYVDWKKQSNKYGTEAEKIASAGLTGTGFSESSQVGMYNAYQNRVATARESYNQAVLNYNNAIKDARLKNNSVLAEIAYNALQQQLELSLQGFQYKNQLLLDQASKKIELDNTYYNRWQDVLNQINHENAMAEEIRQFEENYKLQTQQLELQAKELDESIRQFEKNYDLKIKEFDESIRQFNEEMERLKKKDAQEYELEIKKLELQKQQIEEQKRQFEAEQALKREQLAEEQRQFDQQMASRSSSSGGGGSSNNSGSINKNSTSVKNTTQQSIIDVGYGPRTEAGMAALVSEGKVGYTTDTNGNVIFHRTDGVAPGAANAQSLLDKYTLWK